MLDVFEVNTKVKSKVKKLLNKKGATFNFDEDPLLASLVACLGIQQEVGTINDELHRHIIVKETSCRPALSSMRAEVVKWKGHFGVRIDSVESQALTLKHPQLLHFLHPQFSWNESGELIQLVFFPHLISQIISLQDVELVVVKDWAMNTVFGKFEESENFYVTNDWEIRQNDGLRMAELISKRKLAFLGTHDLTAHVAGVDGRVWNELQGLMDLLIPVMSTGNQQAMTYLIVPYLIGVLLDDLAQPSHYGCSQRYNCIQLLIELQKWIVKRVLPYKSLRRFPRSFSEIIYEARYKSVNIDLLKTNIQKLSIELQIYSEQRIA